MTVLIALGLVIAGAVMGFMVTALIVVARSDEERHKW